VTAKGLKLEWLSWWSTASVPRRIAPAASAVVFLGLNALLGGLSGDHVQLAGAFLALAYLGPRTQPLLRFFLPVIIVAVVYDAQRYWAVPLRGEIHVSEPYYRDLRWFGVRTRAGLEIPAEWCQAHARPALDVLTGLAYLLFVPVFLACAGWWEFRDRNPRAWQVMWSMLVLNLLAYVTYLIYPAAPPWYVARYGLGSAVIGALPESGGGARFDQLLGVHFFAHVYGHNTNVFGAIPSLHVGQTFLAALFAWRFHSLRLVTTGFWLLITFSSVYLNHHYVVDGLVGMAFAVGSAGLIQGYAALVTDRRAT